MALNDLGSLAVVLVVVTIAISMGALVLSEIGDSDAIDADSYADNATNEGLSGLNTAAGFLPVVAIVVIAAVIIGIVGRSFQTQGGM